MEQTSLDLLKKAVQYRALISQLPDGLKQHAQQYEEILIQDIIDKTGCTREEILGEVVPSVKKLLKDAAPIFLKIALHIINKKWPTATFTGIASAIISYLITKYGG
jgi:hypothetical protein